MRFFPVVLAGGKGTRLWPRSTSKRPKQFARIFSGSSLFEMTVERLRKVSDRVFVVVTKEFRDFVPGGDLELIEEPVGKNTGPAVCLAALYLFRNYGDGVMGVFPADHYVSGGGFYEALEEAVRFSWESGLLGTFGIKPSYPETGYGYIERGEHIKGAVFKVRSFREKPPRDVAEEYVSTGRFYWNSGMFVWRLEAILSELEKHAPDIYLPLSSCDIFREVELSSAYGRIPNISVDYAVMEKSDRVFMVEGNFAWSDVGSWKSLWKIMEKDGSGNAVAGKVYLKDVENSLVLAEERVAVIGLSNVAVVEGEGGVLVVPLDRSQEVGEAYKGLEE